MSYGLAYIVHFEWQTVYLYVYTHYICWYMQCARLCICDDTNACVCAFFLFLHSLFFCFVLALTKSITWWISCLFSIYLYMKYSFFGDEVGALLLSSCLRSLFHVPIFHTFAHFIWSHHRISGCLLSFCISPVWFELIRVWNREKADTTAQQTRKKNFASAYFDFVHHHHQCTVVVEKIEIQLHGWEITMVGLGLTGKKTHKRPTSSVNWCSFVCADAKGREINKYRMKLRQRHQWNWETERERERGGGDRKSRKMMLNKYI